jgi:hypothetical protein
MLYDDVHVVSNRLCVVLACVDGAAVLPACAPWFPACFTTASVPSNARLFAPDTRSFEYKLLRVPVLQSWLVYSAAPGVGLHELSSNFFIY